MEELKHLHEGEPEVIVAGPGRIEMMQDGLLIALAEEEDKAKLFRLGHIVMTPGAAALNVDFALYLARHLAGDWGELDAFDARQNNRAVRKGLRILSAYDVPVANEETERIWIITESDRSATTVLTPGEY